LLRLAFRYGLVRRREIAVFIDGRVDAQRRDEADVGAFRRLDGADAAIVADVHVAHFEAGAFAVQAARAQRAELALVRELVEGVRLLDDLRQFAAAEELALKALSVNANDAFVLMDLAWINTMLDRREYARELIDKSLKLAPEDPYVHYIEALMLNKSGDTKAVRGALQQAIKLGYSRVLLGADPNLSNLWGISEFSSLLDTGL